MVKTDNNPLRISDDYDAADYNLTEAVEEVSVHNTKLAKYLFIPELYTYYNEESVDTYIKLMTRPKDSKKGIRATRVCLVDNVFPNMHKNRYYYHVIVDKRMIDANPDAIDILMKCPMFDRYYTSKSGMYVIIVTRVVGTKRIEELKNSRYNHLFVNGEKQGILKNTELRLRYGTSLKSNSDTSIALHVIVTSRQLIEAISETFNIAFDDVDKAIDDGTIAGLDSKINLEELYFDSSNI